MQLGMIGLGRMGTNLVRRLLRDGHTCVVFDPNDGAVQALAGKGATELAGAPGSGDTVIDGGNSYYRDDIRHTRQLAEHGIGLLDCGTSGGAWGRDRGHIPGRHGEVAPSEQGYLHCGPSGAGHFVKMVHNGIEYGDLAGRVSDSGEEEFADKALSAMRKQFGGHAEKAA